MNYTLESVEITNPKIDDNLRVLYQKAFQTNKMLPEGYLYKNTNTSAFLPTYFIVAIDNGIFVGSSAFIPFNFTIGEEKIVGYQIVWSATLPSHQGQRIFINTVNYAKEFFKAKGVSFLFATSNHTSQPIFEKKLGFRVIPNGLLKIPNLPFVKHCFFAKENLQKVNKILVDSLLADEKQIADWKEQEKREKIENVQLGESFIWGKLKVRKKFGVTIPYFYVGGMQLKNPADAKVLMNKIMSQYKVMYIQIVSIETNPYNLMFSGWKQLAMSGCNFFDLNGKTPRKFNMMYGITDTF